MASSETRSERGCFAVWVEWMKTPSDQRTPTLDLGLKDILSELVVAEQELHSVGAKWNAARSTANADGFSEAVRAIDQLTYLVRGCLVALQEPTIFQTAEAGEDEVVRRVSKAFIELCNKHARSADKAVETNTHFNTSTPLFNPVVVIEHLLSQAEQSTTGATAGTDTSQHQGSVTIFDPATSTAVGERNCNCDDCERLDNSHISRLNREARLSFQLKTHNFSLIQRTFLEARRPQVQEFVKFVVMLLQVEARQLALLKRELECWKFNLTSGKSETELQTSLPSRMLSQASLVRGFSQLIVACHQNAIATAIRRGIETRSSAARRVAGDVPLKQLADFCEALMIQSQKLMEIQFVPVMRKMIDGPPLSPALGMLSILTPTAAAAAAAETGPEIVEIERGIEHVGTHEKVSARTGMSTVITNTQGPAPVCHASQVAKVLADSSTVQNPATTSTGRTRRLRAWECLTPQFESMPEWGSLTRTPRQSQFGEEDIQGESTRRDKVKTRPVTLEEDREEEGPAQEQVVDEGPGDLDTNNPARHRWIFKDPAHYDTIRILFPLPGEKDKEGALTWAAFCGAIGAEPFGFNITHQKNVAYTFTRPASDGFEKMSITLHKPHDKQYIQRNIVWNYRKALHHKLGVEAEDIELDDRTLLARAERRLSE